VVCAVATKGEYHSLLVYDAWTPRQSMGTVQNRVNYTTPGSSDRSCHFQVCEEGKSSSQVLLGKQDLRT
jgi:hypothetical protein